MKPKLLDLFCCEGGASMGYSRAGFYLVAAAFEQLASGAGDVETAVHLVAKVDLPDGQRVLANGKVQFA